MKKMIFIIMAMMMCVVAKGQHTNREMLFWMSDKMFEHEIDQMRKDEKYICDFFIDNYHYELPKEGVGALAIKDTVVTNDTITIRFRSGNGVSYRDVTDGKFDISYLIDDAENKCYFSIGRYYYIKYNKELDRNDTIWNGWSWESN